MYKILTVIISLFMLAGYANAEATINFEKEFIKIQKNIMEFEKEKSVLRARRELALQEQDYYTHESIFFQLKNLERHWYPKVEYIDMHLSKVMSTGVEKFTLEEIEKIEAYLTKHLLSDEDRRHESYVHSKNPFEPNPRNVITRPGEVINGTFIPYKPLGSVSAPQGIYLMETRRALMLVE